jgi:hypothetical protein
MHHLLQIYRFMVCEIIALTLREQRPQTSHPPTIFFSFSFFLNPKPFIRSVCLFWQKVTILSFNDA